MADAPWTSSTLLDHVLSGGRLQANDIDDLLLRRIGEDEHLEYKDGEWLDKPDRAARLREYVTSFANMVGGALIVGVRGHDANADDTEEKRPGWSVTGCQMNRLDEWAADSLRPVAHMFSPPARIHTIEHKNGPILVVAVARAPNLVDVVEKSKRRLYLRIGHATVPASEALEADLRLGRRARPQLAISCVATAFGEAQQFVGKLNIELTIANNGLLWVSEAICGWVGYGWERQNATEPPSPGLLPYVEVAPVVGSWPHTPKLLMHTTEVHELQPFRSRTVKVPVVMPAPSGSSTEFVWQGLAFVIPRDGSPLFVQLDYVLATQPRMAGSTGAVAPGHLGQIRQQQIGR